MKNAIYARYFRYFCLSTATDYVAIDNAATATVETSENNERINTHAWDGFVLILSTRISSFSSETFSHSHKSFVI